MCNEDSSPRLTASVLASCTLQSAGSFLRTVQSVQEGREGVKWELGFAFFRGWKMGLCALGLGFMNEKKNNRKMGMGFQFEQHRLGLWDLS